MLGLYRARGEVRADVNPTLTTELISSFAWGRLLTERLDVTDAEIDAVIDRMTFNNAFNNTWEGVLPGAERRRSRFR